VNRADRRRAAREARRSGAASGTHLGDHLDCGCTVRILEPVDPPVCPTCGHRSPFDAMFPLPTSAPIGSLKTGFAWCPDCDTEYEFTSMVVA